MGEAVKKSPDSSIWYRRTTVPALYPLCIPMKMKFVTTVENEGMNPHQVLIFLATLPSRKEGM